MARERWRHGADIRVEQALEVGMLVLRCQCEAGGARASANYQKVHLRYR